MMGKKGVILVLVLAVFVLAAGVPSGLAAELPSMPSCPTVIQMGEVDIMIPAGETAGSHNVQIIRCAGMNVQVTGGTMLQTPVMVNAAVHHDWLLLKAYILEPLEGPVDVTVWWRVD